MKIIGAQELGEKLEQKKYGGIFLKNLLLLSCLIMVPILIVIWIAFYSFHLFSQKEISHYGSQSVAYTKTVMDNMISDCINQMNYMLGDRNISLFLITKKDSVAFYHSDNIFAQIKGQLSTKDYLESIYLYSGESEKILSNYGEATTDNFFDTGWMDKYEKNNKPDYLQCSFRQDKNSFLSMVNFLSFFKTLDYGKTSQGVIVYNVNFDKFSSRLTSNKSEYDVGLCIVDDEDNVIFEVYGDHTEYISANSAGIFKDGEEYVRAKNCILYKTPIEYTSWHFVSAVSTAMYQERLYYMGRTMLIVIICGMLITVSLTFLISKRIYMPIKNISSLLNQPADFMDVKITSKEEAYILTYIGNTIKENKQISKELEERIRLLKKAQSIALQSQINPHFLNNTLDTINWSAMRLTSGKNDVSIMISKLSKMLRYSLENVDNLVPLEVELENCRIYLELEELRYKNKFTVNWDIDESTLNLKVIKIMLQPILENALYYGIKPMNEMGVIAVTSRISGGCMFIKFLYTGFALRSQLLDNLNDSMKSDAIRENNNIGLKNVNQRIQLLFGDHYGIEILPAEQSGTNVILTLPIIEDTGKPENGNSRPLFKNIVAGV